jgi:hypothetical protein
MSELERVEGNRTPLTKQVDNRPTKDFFIYKSSFVFLPITPQNGLAVLHCQFPRFQKISRLRVRDYSRLI